MKSEEINKIVANRITEIQSIKQKPVRVAINGIEGTGKTVFAERLTLFLMNNNVEAKHVSIDGFHFNKKTRYIQGRNSAIGYYENSYDEVSFVNHVLKSSQLPAPTYVTATHDLESDQYLELKPIAISDKSVIITDGAYLFKPAYRPHWDLKIYLKTSFDIALQRGVERDHALFGGHAAAREKFKDRYHQASRLYIVENDPESCANIVIENTDFYNMKLLKNMKVRINES